MTFVWKITSSMHCPTHENRLLSNKRGHFDLVYCSVLKPRSRNSWHHWPCISTSAAVGCTRCSSCLAQPTGEQTPQHSQDSGISIVPTMLTRDHQEMPWLSGHSHRKAKAWDIRLQIPTYKPSPAGSLSTQETGFLVHHRHIGENFHLSRASLKLWPHSYVHGTPHKLSDSFYFTVLTYFMEYCALNTLPVPCLSATRVSEELPLLSLIHFSFTCLNLNLLKQRRVVTGILLQLHLWENVLYLTLLK